MTTKKEGADPLGMTSKKETQIHCGDDKQEMAASANGALCGGGFAFHLFGRVEGDQCVDRWLQQAFHHHR